MTVIPKKPNLKLGIALALALVAGRSPDTAVEQHHPQPVLEGRPPSTLRPDALDAPAATSLAEAERAAELAKGMAGHHGMTHGTPYSHQDAGREQQASPAPKPSPHRHEGDR